MILRSPLFGLSVVAVIIAGCGTNAKDLVVIPSPEKNESKVADIHIIPAEQINVNMGRAVNDFIGIAPDVRQTLAQSCVDIKSSSSAQNSQGSVIKIGMETVTSTQDLFDKTHTNIALTLAKGGWKTSGSQDETLQRTVKATSSYALIRAEKTYIPVNVLDVTAKPFMAKYTAEDMIEGCGTGFVSSITMGARAYALLECETSSSEEKRDLDSKISASAGLFGTQVEGSFQKAINSVVANTSAKCKMTVEFAGGKGTVTADFAKFSDSIISYVTEGTMETSVPLSFATTPYISIRDGSVDLAVAKQHMQLVDTMVDYIDTKKILLNYALARITKAEKTALYGAISPDVQKIIDDNKAKALKASKEMLDCAVNNQCTVDGEW